MKTTLQDMRYAFRMLAKSPGFAAIAVLTLALGIGANTAIFSVMNGLFLHPRGISHPEQVVAIRVRYEKLNLNSIIIFASAALQDSSDFNYAVGDFPQRLRGAKVSWQWFQVFGAKPMLGRVFTPEEDQPHADQEVVLAYKTWKSLFGGDSSIVGRSVQFNRQPYTVVGAMPPDFEWPEQTDLWSPLALPPGDFAIDNIFNEAHFAIARLQPGVTPAQAAAWSPCAMNDRVIVRANWQR